MTNPNLAKDYFKRAKGRYEALKVLHGNGLYADVVREAQELIELALKGIIREAGHAVPMHHDVSAKLLEIKADLPSHVQSVIDRVCEISRSLRRDREIAFYGSEDITPSDFYNKSDGDKALAMAQEILGLLR